ncbi:UDP-N-acetylmuramoyl-L-alanine--D-glutamate ligase [Patescibacteria group bacterium]|jgi:UDP-N-acetylmuramoylalanine--D-glutamate ligase|nr:UDP-N-acetylmuramoyl-L-alanine--D-glutamate ligase [Patescibacteria group bacterium]
MNVLILGLGQYPKGSGIAAALFFAKQGHEVCVTDLKTAKELKDNVKTLKKFKNVRFTLGKHDVKDVRWADLIVRNPRVRKDSREMKEAIKLGKPMESDLSLFFKACPCPIVGVTGTRGKSTTTKMIHEILWHSKKWREVWLGGNILVSPLMFLHQVTVKDLVVLEMSSFQLEATGEAGVSPQIAVWTNLMRDHLNAYPSMAEYAEAKAQIFRHQQTNDVVFFPNTPDFNQYAKEAPGNVVRVKQGKFKLAIPGDHNQMNASFAAAVVAQLGVKASVIKKTLASFKGLENRQEVIAKKNGIIFVNDTTATTPDAAMAALDVFRIPRKKKQDMSGNYVQLIFGGADKELEFEKIAIELGKRKDVAAYVLPGTAHAKIKKQFDKYKVCYMDVKDLKDAFKQMKPYLQSGDVVLLSPGCASFGLFKNEFDRGEQFKKLVKAYGK